MEDKFVEYAPIIIVVLMFLFRNKFFVTPKELSDMKEAILNTVKEDYATKELVQFIREEISEMKQDLRNEIAEMKQDLKVISDFILTRKPN